MSKDQNILLIYIVVLIKWIKKIIKGLSKIQYTNTGIIHKVSDFC